VEQRSLKVVETNKTFFTKITSTISKILIPTRIGLNGVMITIKRNSLTKSYNNYKTADKEKEDIFRQKYEDNYALYLEAIDKFIMDSVYNKVKSGTATNFEKGALEKYYYIVNLKDKHYLEYKYKKQEYLLRIDYENVSTMKKSKAVEAYKTFYVEKIETLYKGLLKNYSVELADSIHNNEEVYNKIFATLENYILEILPIKIEQGNTELRENYEKYEHTTIGKLDDRDKIIQKLILIDISRKIFVHSFPLAIVEKCYIHLLKDLRELIVNSKLENKRNTLYRTLFEVIEDYNIKVLATKIYWENPKEREQYKEFYKKYEKVKDKKKEKEILFLKEEIKKLNIDRKKYQKIIEAYKLELIKRGALKTIGSTIKTYEKLTYNKKG
jgi:hypothetical protein